MTDAASLAGSFAALVVMPCVQNEPKFACALGPAGIGNTPQLNLALALRGAQIERAADHHTGLLREPRGRSVLSERRITDFVFRRSGQRDTATRRSRRALHSTNLFVIVTSGECRRKRAPKSRGRGCDPDCSDQRANPRRSSCRPQPWSFSSRHPPTRQTSWAVSLRSSPAFVHKSLL